MEEKLTFPLRVYPLRSFTVVSALRFMKVTERTKIFQTDPWEPHEGTCAKENFTSPQTTKTNINYPED